MGEVILSVQFAFAPVDPFEPVILTKQQAIAALSRRDTDNLMQRVEYISRRGFHDDGWVEVSL